MIKAELSKSLSNIINVSPEQVLTLLQNFETGDYNFFKSYYDLLAEASFKSNLSGIVKLSVENTAIGEGGSGVVTHNKSEPVVYKQIENFWTKKKDQLIYFKSVFKEVIIQTVLQNDKYYGNNICKIYKLYKYEKGCILKLEALECTLSDRLDKESIKDINKNSVFISEIIVKLYEILDYFKNTYGFQHGDFHVDNVMTVIDGDVTSNLKLIDFGSSYAKFEDLEFGFLSEYDKPDIYRIISYVKNYGYWQGKKRISDRLMGLIKSYLNDGTSLETLINDLKSGNVANAAGGYKRKTRKYRFLSGKKNAHFK